MISCLCVTRGDRLALLAESVADFVKQTFLDRELLIVHDQDAATHAGVQAVMAAHPGAAIRVARVAPGPRLGGLRNAAVAEARGDWLCQWDDDDRCHPLRLELQWDAAQAQGAAASYLVDQLHWFCGHGRLCWDDWDREAYPLNVIQGTILAQRAVFPLYPDIARGEDTLHTHALMRAATAQGFGIARLRGAGWCYIYRHHGGNVWDATHHRAISTAKHMPAARLLPRLQCLRDRLAEYCPALPPLQIPVGGRLEPVTTGPG